MKQQYESEVLYKLMERDGLNIPSSVPPYESEIKQYFIEQIKLAYPKLTDYEAEWLLYNYIEYIPADFPIESVLNVTQCRFENVVPYAYKSAILKGSTKYRDIDTGEILEAFEEGRNLELVSVKMPVLTTTGKNLFNDVLENGWLNTVNGENVVSNNYVRAKNYTELMGNEVYSINTIVNVYYYDVNKDFISLEYGVSTFTTPLNCAYVRFCISDATQNLDKDIQIEQGTQITSYEPYKTNTLSCNEEVELRKVGDVQDTLDCFTGEVTERIGEIVLDGSEDWYINKETETHISYYLTINSNMKKLFKALTNSLPCYYWGDVEDLSKECFWSFISSYGMIVSKTKCPTIEEFKQKLSRNPVLLQYELNKSAIKTVELTITNQDGEECYFMPIEGTMHMSTNGQPIKPLLDVEVPVEAITQNLASFINMKMTDEVE